MQTNNHKELHYYHTHRPMALKNLVPETMEMNEFIITVCVAVAIVIALVVLCCCLGKFLCWGIIIIAFVVGFFAYMWLYRDKP